MAQSHRMQKVEREVRETISTEILKHHSSELKGLVTVSKVLVSADLRQAKVYISQFGEDESVQLNIKYLAAHAYQLQEALGRRLAMKFTPKLKFFFDEAYYAGIAIENQIRQMQKARQNSEPVELVDSIEPVEPVESSDEAE